MKKKFYPLNPLPPDELSFDGLEAKIRGEEVLHREEARREKEERAITKALQDQEVERRLRELKESDGSAKRTTRKRKART